MKLTYCSVILAVVFASVSSLAAGESPSLSKRIIQLKADAAMVGYFDGYRLIDDSLSAKHKSKLAAEDRLANETKRSELDKSIEATLVSAEFNSECRLALREITRDAQTASFISTASTAANSVNANKLTKETLKLSKAIFEKGRTHGQMIYQLQNAVKNCPL